MHMRRLKPAQRRANSLPTHAGAAGCKAQAMLTPDIAQHSGRKAGPSAQRVGCPQQRVAQTMCTAAVLCPSNMRGGASKRSGAPTAALRSALSCPSSHPHVPLAPLSRRRAADSSSAKQRPSPSSCIVTSRTRRS
eukprot:65082-Prymnesium_polylepis.1